MELMLENHLIEMAEKHRDFKINPSRVTGNYQLNARLGLQVDSSKPSDKWSIYDAVTGGFVSLDTITGSEHDLARSFITEWDQLTGRVTDTAPDNVIEEGFEIDSDPLNENTTFVRPYNIDGIISKIDKLLAVSREDTTLSGRTN